MVAFDVNAVPPSATVAKRFGFSLCKIAKIARNTIVARLLSLNGPVIVIIYDCSQRQ
jgi:ascorbate-specific PTS system EIIC-type component UlaA